MKLTLQLVLFFLLPMLAAAQTSPAGVLTSSSCRLWLDAGDMNADGNYNNNPSVGTAVSTWSDKSGNANDLTQSTASAKPSYSTNGGYSAVKFDNSGTNTNYLSATTQTMLTPGTMYFVLNIIDVGDAAYTLFDRNSSGNTSIRFNQYNGSNLLGYTKYATADYTSSIASSYSTNVIVSFVKSSASNNVDVAQNNASVTTVVGSSNPGLPLYVLGKNTTNDGLNGFVLETLVYNVDLNTAQKMIVDNYLSAKYGGISIISDKYVGDNTANGDYDFDVGGVGTESTGSSTSVATSIAGGLGVTEATATENGEYLIYGHQTGTNSINYYDVNGMSSGPNKARWNRIWYLNFTHVGGTTETYNLTFDFSDAGSAGGNAATPLSNYKLLYRSGQSGNWTEVMSASSISGDRVTFNGLAWNTAGNGYYTIGSLDYNTSPLPIELLKFEAEPCDNNVCLYWSTATEKNTDHFVIEKSADGQHWEDVSKTPAAGNSSTKRNYEAIDTAPLNGTSYYRLTTVDRDLTTSYAPLQSVSLSKDTPLITVFPNPSGGVFTITIANNVSPDWKYELFDPKGMLVKVIPYTSENSVILDLSSYQHGIYFLNISSPSGFLERKKIILR